MTTSPVRTRGAGAGSRRPGLFGAAYLRKDHNLVDTVRTRLSDVVNNILAKGQAEDARHRRNGDVHATLLVHENRQNEVGRRDYVLTDRRAESLAAAVAARPRWQVLRGQLTPFLPLC